jgi:spore coat protein U-like protein
MRIMKAIRIYQQGKRKIYNNLSLVTTSLFASLLVFLILSISPLQAATQGSSGTSSGGTVEINIVKNRLIVIKGLRDFNFGNWNSGDGTLSDNDDVCIGKTDLGAPYGIRAAGNGNGFDPAAFTLSNGVDQINYNVYWNDANGTGGNAQLTPGLILHGQTGTALSFLFNLFICTNNANIQIEIPDTELQAASGGIYSGTLTLLVIPD